MERPLEPFADYISESEPNNDRDCVSLGQETFIKKNSLFKEFPELLESDLGIPKSMASQKMGELLQIIKENQDIKDVKGEEFVESWLYHQIGQFLRLNIGHLFVYVLSSIKRICNHNQAIQQYLKQLCSRNPQKKNYQDFFQMIQKTSNNTQIKKLQSQVFLIQNMHKDLRKEWDQVKENPELIEHILLKIMLANFQSRNHKVLEKTVFKQSQRNTTIEEINTLGLKIRYEGIMCPKAQRYFEKCKQFFKNKNNNSQFYDNLEALKKQISIVDDFLLKKIQEETKEQNVQDKDIIFLIGPTGAGKTTLILWLLGYNMVLKNQGRFKTLTPEGQKKPEHQALLTDPGSKPVTRFIYSTKIPCSREDEKLQICDSPGFFDSASTEVDIINGIGMINAIKKCRSVKPVIVFNGMALGNRYSEVKNLGKLVSKLFSVSDFIDVKQNIQFIFNKFTKDGLQEFRAGVKQIINGLTVSDQADVKYVGFLNHLDETLDKSEDPNVRLVFTPESKEISRQKWIEKLKKSPVSQPAKIFQYSYSSESKQKIEKAAQRLCKRIISYLGRDEFCKNIKHILYYFRKLSRIYNIVDGLIINVYDQIQNKLRSHYDQLFDRFSKHLTEEVMENQLNANTFSNMKKIREEIEQFQQFFSQQFFGLDNIKKLEKMVRQKQKYLQRYFQEANFQHDMNLNKLKINIEVVKKCIFFSNNLKDDIKNIFDKKYQEVSFVVSQRIQTLEFQNFQEDGWRYLQICKWKSLYEDKEEDYYEKKIYDNINNRLEDEKDFIQKNITRVGNYGRHLQINQINFGKLRQNQQKFKRMESCQFLRKSNFREIYQNILKILVEECEKIMNKVVSILSGDQISRDEIKQIETLIYNRDKLAEIGGVSALLKITILDFNESLRIIFQSEVKTINQIFSGFQNEAMVQNLGAEVAKSFRKINTLSSLCRDEMLRAKVNHAHIQLEKKMLACLGQVTRKTLRHNRFNIGDKKRIQNSKIQITINIKKKIDFLANLELFQSQKHQILQFQKQINEAIIKPFNDINEALQKANLQISQSKYSEKQYSQLINSTISKYQNFVAYFSIFLQKFWEQQFNQLVGGRMQQIVKKSTQFFDFFFKSIDKATRIQSLKILCESENNIKDLERSFDIVKRLEQSQQLANYIREQIGFCSQNQYKMIENFIKERKKELNQLIEKANNKNQELMAECLEYTKKMSIFDKFLNEDIGEEDSFEHFKKLLESKRKKFKKSSVKYFGNLISEEDGLQVLEIQNFYEKFKNSWQREKSKLATDAELFRHMVSKLHNYFKNQRTKLGGLLKHLGQNNLYFHQDSRRYLSNVQRVRKQIDSVIKMFENEPVKNQFNCYREYILNESLIGYNNEFDGQMDEIIELIKQFKLKQMENRLKRFKQIELQIKGTIVQDKYKQRLEAIRKKIGNQEMGQYEFNYIYQYLENLYKHYETKMKYVLKFQKLEDLQNEKGIINIHDSLQTREKDHFRVQIERIFQNQSQQIVKGWKLGNKIEDQKFKLDSILKSLPLEIRSNITKNLERKKRQIKVNLQQNQRQIMSKISKDTVNFQEIINFYRQIQFSDTHENLLKKYQGFTRHYFKVQESKISKIQNISQFVNFFRSKILAFKSIIYKNENKLNKIKKQFANCEFRIVLVLSQIAEKNIKNLQNYLGKGKIQCSGTIQRQVQQIFVVYDVIQKNISSNNKFKQGIVKFLNSLTKQYKNLTIQWEKLMNIQFECQKQVLTSKIQRYHLFLELNHYISNEIKNISQFSEIYHSLSNDKIKGILNTLGQKIEDVIRDIKSIKFYSDDLKSMNQIQVTNYLQNYQRYLQKLKKFKQVFAGEKQKLIGVDINIEDLQGKIIGQWQRQNISILQNIRQNLQDFNQDVSEVFNRCNVLDFIFKIVKQKRISPLWKELDRLNELPLTTEIQKVISQSQNKCRQSLKEIIQTTQRTQKDIQQELEVFKKKYIQSQESEKNENNPKIDKSRQEIQYNRSLKPQKKNQKIQAITGNIQKLSNDKLREMQKRHESLISRKKNMLIKSQENGLRVIAVNLVKIKRISLYIQKKSKDNNEWMNGFLKQLGQKNRQRMVNLEKYLRETKAEVEVKMIINDSGAFPLSKAETYVRQTKDQDIQYLLREIPEIRQKTDLADKYRKQYDYYWQMYSRIQENYKLDCTSEFKRRLAEEIRKKGQYTYYKKSELVAKIFALWSILKLDDDESEIVFSFNPHPAQIMAILFLINCFQGKEKIKNRFAEVLTGEGKSVVLAGLCSYLAVCGYKAYCVCYSEYLSMRDNQEFRILFSYLGILDKVKYGPFNVHCQDFLNAEGAEKTFKESIKQFVINEQSFLDKMKSFFGTFFESLANKFTNKYKLQKRVLIIDEVDVFFDQKFYGQIYRPAITLDSEQIQNLLLQVWQLKKSDKLSTKEIQKSQWFIKTINKYPHLQNLLKNQLNGMIRAAKDPSHTYIINNECLCYIDNQSISYEINYGFKTVFANCLQFDRKRVSLTNRNKSLKISLIVCQFSYAELPKYFKVILGVSGTINAIPQYKKTDMRDIYDIKEVISIPSIYSKKVVTESYEIVKNESFDKILSQHIQKIYKQSRPVIVFFSGAREMYRYRSCPEFNHLKSLSYILSEETENDHRDQIIQRAGQKGLITLITSSLARGTDFKIYQKSVIEAGGLHVIQTYLSMNESDFIQIKGTTARQGKDGSFEFLLKESDLELLEIKYDEGQLIPNQLRRAWKLNDKKIGETYKQKLIKATEKDNQNVKRFSKNASQAQWINYIQNLNGYEEIKNHHLRTVIGIDGTASMAYALKNVLLTIQRVVQRISVILYEQKFNGSQEIEIVIYRNYGSDYELLLQCSGFESSATKLTEFLRKITASGDEGNQALEVLLQYINRRENVSQVIVIGDAAPNNPDEVKRKRSIKPQSHWNQHNFPMTTCEEQMKKIIQNNIPIHSFYLKSGDYFSSLSRDTGGHSEQFVLNSPNTEKSLIDFFSVHILKALDPSERLLDAYRRRY